MLDKCRNITSGRKQTADIVLAVSNRCQLSQKLGLTPLSARDAAWNIAYRSSTASTEIFEMLKTISRRAHWYRRTQKRAFRPYGELFRPLVKENWATERISVVLWNKHVCKNFSDLLHISSNTSMQLHKSGSKWQCVLYGRFHMRLKALRHAVQKADKLPPDKSQSSHP